MSAETSHHRPATNCVHAGTYLDAKTNGACSPIFPSTAYGFPNAADENFYPRYFNTPNQQVIAVKVQALEFAEDGLVFGSGMAAITTVLLTLLQPGDHALFQSDLYGGTVQFLRELRRLGVAVSHATSAEELATAIRPNTKVIYVETPSNPLLRLVDLDAIGKLGRQHGIITVADNTFATPINQNPIQFGIDVVIHSATKYLNGHSDLNAGLVLASSELIHRVRETALNYGGVLDAQACFMLERGLKTLALRVERHNQNAQLIAEYLERHPAVNRVNYPGLKSHPQHALAKRQMRGFGGMLSFEAKTKSVNELLAGFRIVQPALSLGGVESLVCVPSQTSHRKMTAVERHEAGISDGLVRVSVGIEDVDDLLEDFRQALDHTAI